MNKRSKLLVEDRPHDVRLTKRAFVKCNLGNEIIVARDGQEAIDILLGDPAAPLPALVLLDLTLPKVDGIDVLRAIRSDPRTRLLPVVILTSPNRQDDIAASYAGGANSYIRKPVAFHEFVEAVAQLGLYWLALNEPPA